MKKNLVFLSLESWDDIWRRNQFVCAELAQRGYEILFVQPAKDLSAGLRRRDWSQFSMEPVWSPSGLPRISVMRPVKIAPKTLAFGRAANAELLRNSIRKQLNRLGWREPILWINEQGAGHLAGRLGESAVVYDITDDWTAFESHKRFCRVVERQDRELCEKADAVIVCSQHLFDLKADLVRADRLHLIPNGVHVEHYESVGDGKCAPPNDARDWQHPILGYTGTIHPDRLDVELVRRLAQAPGIGSIVLVGPNHLRQSDLAKLRLPNVFIHGPVPYEKIPAVMESFDVCIVPHLKTAFTESLNPIKLWEYLAAGKPIVATDVAGFRDFPDLVEIARDDTEFIDACRQALLEGSGKRHARRAEARKHSWIERVESIETVLTECSGCAMETENVF